VVVFLVVLVIAGLPVPSAEAGAGRPVSPGLEGGGFTPPPQSRPQGPQRLTGPGRKTKKLPGAARLRKDLGRPLSGEKRPRTIRGAAQTGQPGRRPVRVGPAGTALCGRVAVCGLAALGSGQAASRSMRRGRRDQQEAARVLACRQVRDRVLEAQAQSAALTRQTNTTTDHWPGDSPSRRGPSAGAARTAGPGRTSVRRLRRTAPPNPRPGPAARNAAAPLSVELSSTGGNSPGQSGVRPCSRGRTPRWTAPQAVRGWQARGRTGVPWGPPRRSRPPPRLPGRCWGSSVSSLGSAGGPSPG